MKQNPCEKNSTFPSGNEQSPIVENPLDCENSDDPIITLAKERFNIAAPYPFQRLVINNILCGCGYYGQEVSAEAPKKQIVILPTGAGKSLCFILPGLLISGITLIVYPLLALMTDQARRIESIGAHAVIIRGGQTNGERKELWNKLYTGKARFILTNPEMLCDQEVAKKLQDLHIAHAVIDETHTVSEWGESFRSSYLEIGSNINALSPDQITACTATASPAIIEKIINILFQGQQPHIISGNPDRSNISYQSIPTLSKNHDLASLCKREVCKRPILVFCSSRVGTIQTAYFLTKQLQENTIRYYHAGLSRAERDHIESWFFSSSDGILCTTTAYGMGVDKKNIRTVIHYNLSSSVEAYLQESGRAGRDQDLAKAIVLLGFDDVNTTNCAVNYLDVKEAGMNIRRKTIQSIFLYNSHCRREQLLSALGADCDICFGCDICTHSTILFCDGETEIMRLLQEHPLKFTIEDIIYILKGSLWRHHYERRYWRNRSFGVLKSWTIEEIEQAINTLLAMKVIHISSNILWKYRVKPAVWYRKFHHAKSTETLHGRSLDESAVRAFL